MYQLEYTLNDRDYLQFNRHHLAHDPLNRRWVFILRLAMPVLLAISLLSDLPQMNGLERIARVMLYSLAAIAWAALVKPYFHVIMRASLAFRKRRGNLPYGKNVRMAFESDSFTETTEKAETKVGYGSIERIESGKDALYVYLDSTQAAIIPFSAFESQTQKDAFAAFVQGRAKASKAAVLHDNHT